MESAADPDLRAEAALLLGDALVASGDAAAAERVVLAVHGRAALDRDRELALEATLLAAQTLARSPPDTQDRLGELGGSLSGATASERVLLSRIALAEAASGEHVAVVRDLAQGLSKTGSSIWIARSCSAVYVQPLC